MYYEDVDYDRHGSLYNSNSVESPLPFEEEIDHTEIQLLEVIGKGTFGLVRRGRWRGQDVAVKCIESDHERKAFLVEVRQLSRVSHPNIVKLYGARVHHPVYLVMEYAEGGSLYNVLHVIKNIHYTAGHAISWVLQCARGVAYLHNMKPKALVHRDLKPPNLLLVNGGTVLKICDFGTACDVQTVMTNNKGSAAWMAPEVFESSNYTEKCDVFSWGIILWEVLTREKPFEDCGPPFSIMWAVHTGKRPPLIKGCPIVLENLMTRCWAKNPDERPSMSDVEYKMMLISRYFSGGDQPLSYPAPTVDSHEAGDGYVPHPLCARSDTWSFWASQGQPTSITAECNRDKAAPNPSAVNFESCLSRTSAPASLACSTEDMSKIPHSSRPLRDSSDSKEKRQSVDFSVLSKSSVNRELGHRRAGSTGSAQASGNIVWDPSAISSNARKGDAERHRRANVSKGAVQGVSTPHRSEPRKTSWPSTPESPQDVDLGLSAHLLIEPALQPLPPAQHCRKSVELFEAHRRLSQWHFKLCTEIALLKQRSMELDKELQQPAQECPMQTYYDERKQLKEEKEGLISLRENLRSQLQTLKVQQDQREQHDGPNGLDSDDWVMVTQPSW